jgi:hypothetical protein
VCPKSERLDLPSEAYISKHLAPSERDLITHNGIEGPIVKSFPNFLSDLHEPFWRALEEFGVKRGVDPVNVSLCFG